MFRTLTRFGLAAALLLMAGGRSAIAYSLLGPLNAEAYQTQVIGYGLTPAQGDNKIDQGTPRNIAEEYRWNTPFLYYACDANFLDFFGANGLADVDGVFAVFNNTVSNLSSYSSNLTEFPLNSSRFNFRAQALNCIDLKTCMMQLVMEELGVGEPD